MEAASELLRPLVSGEDYLTNGSRLVLVVGYIDSEDAYWIEDASADLERPFEDRGVGKVPRIEIGEGRPWQIVDRG